MHRSGVKNPAFSRCHGQITIRMITIISYSGFGSLISGADIEFYYLMLNFLPRKLIDRKLIDWAKCQIISVVLHGNIHIHIPFFF